MRVIKKYGMLITAVSAITAAGAFAAAAATIDFTAGSNTSGSVGGIGWNLVARAGDTITFEERDAPGPIGPLAGMNDGVGLNDDEISEGGEYLTIVFDQAVRLTGFWTLDLFRDGSNDVDPETAQLFLGSTPTGTPVASLRGTEVYTRGALGFGFLGDLNIAGTTFTFNELDGVNDGKGVGDFALAGIEIAPIPLPAGGLLFGTGLMALGLMRRRG